MNDTPMSKEAQEAMDFYSTPSIIDMHRAEVAKNMAEAMDRRILATINLAGCCRHLVIHTAGAVYESSIPDLVRHYGYRVTLEQAMKHAVQVPSAGSPTVL